MNKKTNRNIKLAAAFGVGAVATGAFLDWNNTNLQLTKYTLEYEKLPQGFDGFKIVHISDFHNTAFLENKAVRFAKSQKPDIIVVTGDLFDSRRTDVATGYSMAAKLVEIAPVYMVCGNHEARIEITPLLLEELENMGVTIIEDKQAVLRRNGDTITLTGIADPRAFAGEKLSYDDKRGFIAHLTENVSEIEGFKIILSHRPDFFVDYCRLGMDLVFSGHAHGGQFGIPFTDRGVYLPSQGLLPKYAAGKKQNGDTTMIISRGIGNSQFPFRLFNLPEVVSVELKKI